MPTLIAAMRTCAATQPGTVSFHHQGQVTSLTTTDVLREAEARAHVLVERGVSEGSRVGVLGPNHPEWLLWAVATWRAGGTLVPLPYGAMTTIDAVRNHVDGILRTVPCEVVVAAPEFRDVAARAIDWSAPVPPSATTLPEASVQAEDIAVVQCTSGSTAAPKGVLLSHRAVLAGLAGATQASRWRPDEAGPVSWMPLFHDWGLFAYLLAPVVHGLNSHLLRTEEFLVDPMSWLRIATQVKATGMPGPPSAWGHALMAAATDASGIDLSSVRSTSIAAEPISPLLLEAMRDMGPVLGLGPATSRPCYGMAELTLAATVDVLDEPPTVDHLDPDDLRRDAITRVAAGTGCAVVGCGRATPGTEIEIRRDGAAVGDDQLGEITVRSTSMLSGWQTLDGIVPLPEDGWLPTGDLGYLHDGQLFVTGRIKDLIIAMGRNYAAQDLEWAADAVRGVRTGRSVAFSATDQEGAAVVVVEPGRRADPEVLVREVRKAVGMQVGLTPRRVVVVERGSIPKTTSGKLRRRHTRDLLDKGALVVLAG